jgi:hypothetical protein
MLIEPIFVGRYQEIYAINLLMTIVLIAGVLSIVGNRALRLAAITLMVPVLFARWSAVVFDIYTVAVIGFLCATAFFALNTFTVVSVILKTSRVTTDTIFGSICGYILIGMCWAMMYLTVLLFVPDAFSNTTVATDSASRLINSDFNEMVYYSFVSLSTLGFGDISPVHPMVRVLTYLEALVGQIYLTVLVARLVGLHMRES